MANFVFNSIMSIDWLAQHDYLVACRSVPPYSFLKK